MLDAKERRKKQKAKETASRTFRRAGSTPDGKDAPRAHPKLSAHVPGVRRSFPSFGGYAHSLFAKSDGTLWAMGYNAFGQLGNGTTVSTNLPISVASNVVAVAAGYAHSLFAKSDGTLWAMGMNSSGQLGSGTTVNTNRPVSVASNVIAVAVGERHSLFLKSDGSLWAMGYNSFGQLGNGTSDILAHPVSVSVASNVVAVTAGLYHTLFVKADGSLWAMGSNLFGQLGNGTLNTTNRPVRVPDLTIASLGMLHEAEYSLAIGTSRLQISGPTNSQVYLGQPAGFSVTVTNGDGPFSYQWQLNGNDLLDATNSTCSIASVALTNSGTYSVTVTGVGGSATNSATLTVNVSFPTLALASSNWAGAQQLNLQVGGLAGYSYVLQATTNLTNPVQWVPLQTNAADSYGSCLFVVTNLNFPAMFYRVAFP